MLIILLVLVIGFIAIIIWAIKETWNEPGILGRLEEANRLKRLDLESKNNKKEAMDKSKQIDTDTVIKFNKESNGV